MAALIPAFSRSRGRVDPSVFGHVIRLVQHEYLPGSTGAVIPTSVAAPSHRHRRLAHSSSRANVNIGSSHHQTPTHRTGDKVTARYYSASAQAVEVDHDEPSISYHPPPPPRPARRLWRTDGFESPSWAHLPPPLASALSQGSITSPAQICTDFDTAQCKSGQLASVDTLERVFSLFLRSAEPSQWAWLSGQLGHMLAAIHDAGDFHPAVPTLGSSIRAYCLAQLGQKNEARVITGYELSGNVSDLATSHGVRAITLFELDEREMARDQMIRAIRRGLGTTAYLSDTIKFGRFLTTTLEECFAHYAERASQDDMLYIMRKAASGDGGNRFRRLLVDSSLHDRHPIFVKTWHDWLANASVSMSLFEGDHEFGNFLRRHHLLILSRQTPRAHDALDMFDDLRRRGEHLRPAGGTVLSLIGLLLREDMLLDARRLLDEIPHPAALKSKERIGLLRLYAETTKVEGLREKAEALWKVIIDRGVPADYDRQAFATIRAREGDLAGTVDILGHADTPGNLDQTARLQLLLFAAIRADDADAAESYFTSLVELGPDQRALTQMVRLAARLDRPALAKQAWTTFEEAGYEPDLIAYTTLIDLHGRRREVDLAENTFERMLESGIEPDTSAWGALLDAYAEAGDWEGMARRWDDLPEACRAAGSTTAAAMKALVLRGATISQVLEIFRRIDRPTIRHWALLLQSASDHSEHQLMEKLFSEMDSLSRQSSQAAQPNVFVYSIRLHAYLKSNDAERARAIYDEMLSRDILPSSVTYAMIIRSYAKGSTGSQGLEQAQKFAMSIYNLTDKSSPLASKSIDDGAWDPAGKATERLLSPMVVASGQAGRPKDAERYFDLITKNTEPSILLLTQYLDAWRRADETSMVMKIWADLFSLACRTISYSPAIKSRPHSSRRQRQPDNAVAIPLTIVLVTLGKEKRLLDIRRVWDDVRSAGFGFDTSNFNQLAVSLAQSGDVEGAFDVVENVLLDNPEASNAVDNPLDAEELPADFTAIGSDGLGETTDAAFRPPNRRVHAESPPGFSSSADDLSLVNRLPEPHREDLWRPHYRTLVTLDSVISQLESSQDKRAWMGLATTEEAEDDPDLDADAEATANAGDQGEVVRLHDFNTHVRDPSDGRPKKTSARGLLMKLNRKYSKAMALVMFHRKKQSARSARSYSSNKRGRSKA